ncbi:MAG: threonylcarbamoyl-AMP synthase [Bacteroidales bacterium]|nr:threonylcarbamoyl-AMP synthase [Bacteroidales bacterium]
MDEEIKKSLKVLNDGGIIVYPTDTIWGIGCDATNEKAIRRIYHLKKRHGDKTFIVLLSDKNQIPDYVDNIPDIVWDLLESYKKPLTIIYNNAKNLAKNLIREDQTIAIRVTNDKFSRRLIEEFGKPIVSTSANYSGDNNPLTFNMISKGIIDSVDYVVDLYHQSMNEVKPSTIIKFHENGEFEIIRS